MVGGGLVKSPQIFAATFFLLYGDIYPQGNTLKKNFNVTSIKPVINLSDESKILLEEANYTFIERNPIPHLDTLQENNDVIIFIETDEDGCIDYYKWTSSIWNDPNDPTNITRWETFDSEVRYASCQGYSDTSVSIVSGSVHAPESFHNLPTGFQTITIHAIDDYGVRSNPLVFNLTILPDYDFDGVPDYLDDFWWDETEWVDTDKDGYGDNMDLFPNDSDEWVDTDEDGLGNNADHCDTEVNGFVDKDGDGYCEILDICPDDPEDWSDSDSDGVCDNADEFPSNAAEWVDTDRDGYGDNEDLFPSNYNEWYDTDGDGIGDNSDILPGNRFFHAPWQLFVFTVITGLSGISVKHGYHLFKLSTKVDNKIDEVKKIIFELNEKGINTKNLDRIVEEVEEEMKKWTLK